MWNKIPSSLGMEISYLFRGKRKIKKDTSKYIQKLSGFSDKELCEMYTNLNIGKWDKRLGGQPIWQKEVDTSSYHKHMYSVRRTCEILEGIERIFGKKTY